MVYYSAGNGTNDWWEEKSSKGSKRKMHVCDILSRELYFTFTSCYIGSSNYFIFQLVILEAIQVPCILYGFHFPRIGAGAAQYAMFFLFKWFYVRILWIGLVRSKIFTYQLEEVKKHLRSQHDIVNVSYLSHTFLRVLVLSCMIATIIKIQRFPTAVKWNNVENVSPTHYKPEPFLVSLCLNFQHSLPPRQAFDLDA